MADISRTALFGKLDELAYRSLESATVFCKMRGNPYVELSHWVHQVLQQSDSDLHRIVRHYEVDASRLARDLLEALDRLPRGATSVSDLSTHVEEATERGWLYASLKFGQARVRVGHLVVGIVKTANLRNALVAISREFSKIAADDVVERLPSIIAGSPEDRMAAAAAPGEAAPPAGDGSAPPAALGRQEALAKYSVDLVDRARKKEIDAIVGRDEEIRQVVQVLMRRRQNNPILTGEAGVGKTAVVEGLAIRIAQGDVPPALKDVSLRTLDIGLLQAGASMKGEFENRLRQVIEEVQASPKPIILFIDEAHTLIGAGGAAGTGDAANLLKPALARGTLRTIAATTWAEYKKHIEKDPALTRRFQVVVVEEPSEPKAVLMLRGLVGPLEKHHHVQLLDEAIHAAVTLSHRYIPDRQLPDKAVSLLDTASARVAVSQHGVPAPIEDARRTIESLDAELSLIERERAVGIDTGDRKAAAEKTRGEVRGRLDALEHRWKAEKALVDQILAKRDELRRAAADEKTAGDDGRSDRLAHLAGLERELTSMQGEDALILPSVDEQAIAAVVSDWTGIPVGRMVKNEIETVLRLADLLGKRVVGQSHALELIAKRIQTARAGLENPNKPIGVFLLVGPSGVGKTETALTLAEALYGGEQNVITINMSEYQEAHTVSTLKGSPPGYVGYGEGGVLTEAVRRRPYSVVLLDEVEKAHPDVHELFFQVFDKGWMEDGQGTRVDFKNTIILLTSNAGSDVLMRLCDDGRQRPADNILQEALRPALLQVFPAALLGRMVTIPYYPLSDEVLGGIIRLQLDRVGRRVREQYDVPFTYDQTVVDLIASRCTEVESGGRMIDAVLTNALLPQMSRELLRRNLDGVPAKKAEITAQGGEFVFAFE
jgi:type VI secretion system protein VasG